MKTSGNIDNYERFTENTESQAWLDVFSASKKMMNKKKREKMMSKMTS